MLYVRTDDVYLMHTIEEPARLLEWPGTHVPMLQPAGHPAAAGPLSNC